MRDRNHDDAMAEIYREDPAYAFELLNSIFEDGDQSELLIALRQMTKACGRNRSQVVTNAKTICKSEC